MSRDITVAAEVRTSRGKNEAHRTRMAGKIPAVVYGAFQDPVSVSVNPREISKIVHSKTGYNTIFNLAIEGGETTPVMVVDSQVTRQGHPAPRRSEAHRSHQAHPRHRPRASPRANRRASRFRADCSKSSPAPSKSSACRTRFPRSFTVNVSELMIGQSRRACHVALSGSMKLISAPDSVIAHCVALRAEEEPAAATAEAAAPEAAAPGAEPEVIKKGKKDEEAPADEKEKGKKK